VAESRVINGEDKYRCDKCGDVYLAYQVEAKCHRLQQLKTVSITPLLFMTSANKCKDNSFISFVKP